MQRSFPHAAAIKFHKLKVNQLAMLLFNGTQDRVKVVQIDRSEEQVCVDRIDYGDTLILSSNALYEATDLMHYLPPLTFPALITNAAVDINVNDTISVCWMDQEYCVEGYYYMRQEILAKSLPAPIKRIDVQVVKKLTARTQVLFVEDPTQASHYADFFAAMQKEQLHEDNGTLRNGEMVAAWHEKTWKRAQLLCHSIWKKLHLVYLTDEAKVIFCSDLRYLPPRLGLEAARVIVLECVDEVDMVNLPTGAKGVLELDENCTLHLDTQYRVKLLDAQQLFVRCDYGFWYEELQHGDIIKIASAETLNELRVVSIAVNLLREVLPRLTVNCEPWLPSVECENWQDKLVVAQAQNNSGDDYMLRGKVKYIRGNGLIIMHDIDMGVDVLVNDNDVYIASDLVRALPAKVG